MPFVSPAADTHVPITGGPRTHAGKANSSRNALKHGLTSKAIVVFDESPEEFDAFKAGVSIRLQPADSFEEFLVERIAVCAWRLRRAQRIEREIFDGYNSIQFFSPFQQPTAGAVYALDAAAGEKLGKLARHEAAIERSMLRALHELQRLQAVRNGIAVSVPGVLDVDIAVGKGERNDR